MEFSIEDEVNQVSVTRPHVVILGAGASVASFPNGDRNGKPLPLMKDLNIALGFGELFKKWNEKLDDNFEDTYSRLAEAGETEKTRVLEDRIWRYFQQLRLPEAPTLYDQLILSLRETDLIATFNWDPLIVEAYTRNQNAGFKLPQIAFLHGNVGLGYCDKDKRYGNEFLCPKCHEPFTPSKLLYPIRKKDYASNGLILDHWNLLKWSLARAFMVTIFGYSGPKTDKEAIEAMKISWGKPEERTLEQIVFITRDLSDEDRLLENWKDFVFSHHYSVTDNFYTSWIANHPRRVGEAWENQNLQGGFIDNNPVPKFDNLNDLWNWFHQFKPAEDKARKK